MSINRVPNSAGLLLLVFLFQEAFINRINFYLGGFTLYLAFAIAWILTLSIVTTIFCSIALMLFVIFGAILGQDLPSLSVLARELIGNALWSFVLAPLYIPIAIRTHKLSLSARER